MYLHQFQVEVPQKHPVYYSKDIEQLRANLKNNPRHLHVILTRRHYSLFIKVGTKLCQIDSLGPESPIKVDRTDIILSLSTPTIHCARFLLLFIIELQSRAKLTLKALNESLRDVCKSLRHSS